MIFLTKTSLSKEKNKSISSLKKKMSIFSIPSYPTSLGLIGMKEKKWKIGSINSVKGRGESIIERNKKKRGGELGLGLLI
jgi:hypothetical protein